MEANAPWHQAVEAVAALTDDNPKRHISSGQVHRFMYGDKPLMDQQPSAVVRRWLDEATSEGVLRKHSDPDHPYHDAYVFSVSEPLGLLTT